MRQRGTTGGRDAVEGAPSELHPEEMLSAARQGTLDARARRDLAAHLDRCAACRLELALGADILRDGQPQGGDEGLLSEMVQRSLAEKTPRPLELHSGFGRSWPPMRRIVLPALCVLLGGSVATGMLTVRHDFRHGPTIESIAPGRDQPVRHRSSARPAAPPTYLAPLSAEEQQDLEPRPEPAPVAAPAPPSDQQPVRPSHRRVVALAPAAPEPSAGDLFAGANRARRAGDYGPALAAYRQLSARFPGSREEITSRMIVGELMLARQNPTEALKQFDRYLAASPNGTLAEEARVGRASALGALGRVADERAAWRDFLRQHPMSVHAERAKLRLSQLR